MYGVPCTVTGKKTPGGAGTGKKLKTNRPGQYTFQKTSRGRVVLLPRTPFSGLLSQG